MSNNFRLPVGTTDHRRYGIRARVSPRLGADHPPTHRRAEKGPAHRDSSSCKVLYPVPSAWRSGLPLSSVCCCCCMYVVVAKVQWVLVQLIGWKLYENNISFLQQRLVIMPVQNEIAPPAGYGLGNAICAVCQENFGVDERMVNSNGQILHERCFVWVWLFIFDVTTQISNWIYLLSL